MPGPYPLATLGPTVDATGISAPPFSDILASLFASAQAIYGADFDLDPDSPDGQMIGIYSLAQHNSNDGAVAVYNSYSPATAIGAGLSSVVKINNLTRQSSTNSTADLTIIGQAGVQIFGGIVNDQAGNPWALPPLVTIPFGGEIIVGAVCSNPGSITAPADSIGFGTVGTGLDTLPITAFPGWQSASNLNPALPGAPVETDAHLRLRQSGSPDLPAKITVSAIEAAIANVPGVQDVAVFSNSQDPPDLNGIPGHSIAAVVAGGDPAAIAVAIAAKAPGTGTYGTVSEQVFDSRGVPDQIQFFDLTLVPVYVGITVQPLLGYLITTGNMLVSAVITYINSLLPQPPYATTVYRKRVIAAADLSGSAATLSSGLTQAQLDVLSATYVITSLTLGTAPGSLLEQDIPLLFYQAPQLLPQNVSFTLLPP